jgi:molybdopterin synthase catalytic subunit
LETSAGVHKKGTLTLAKMIRDVKRRPDFPKAGAIGLFVGVARGQTLKGENVQKLELEAYEEKADEVLKKICDELKKKPGIVDVQIHHLLGEFEVGENLVYVIVAGSHRKQVFPVLEEAVERYKKEAPIFKKELIITSEGVRKSHWTAEQREE